MTATKEYLEIFGNIWKRKGKVDDHNKRIFGREKKDLLRILDNINHDIFLDVTFSSYFIYI